MIAKQTETIVLCFLIEPPSFINVIARLFDSTLYIFAYHSQVAGTFHKSLAAREPEDEEDKLFQKIEFCQLGALAASSGFQIGAFGNDKLLEVWE